MFGTFILCICVVFCPKRIFGEELVVESTRTTWRLANFVCESSGYILLPGRSYRKADLLRSLSVEEAVWIKGWRMVTENQPDDEGNIRFLKTDFIPKFNVLIQKFICEYGDGKFSVTNVPKRSSTDQLKAEDSCRADGGHLAEIGRHDVKSVLDLITNKTPHWSAAVTTADSLAKQCLAAKRIPSGLKYYYEDCEVNLPFVCLQDQTTSMAFAPIVSKRYASFRDFEVEIAKVAGRTSAKTSPKDTSTSQSTPAVTENFNSGEENVSPGYNETTDASLSTTLESTAANKEVVTELQTTKPNTENSTYYERRSGYTNFTTPLPADKHKATDKSKGPTSLELTKEPVTVFTSTNTFTETTLYTGVHSTVENTQMNKHQTTSLLLLNNTVSNSWIFSGAPTDLSTANTYTTPVIPNSVLFTESTTSSTSAGLYSSSERNDSESIVSLKISTGDILSSTMTMFTQTYGKRYTDPSLKLNPTMHMSSEQTVSESSITEKSFPSIAYYPTQIRYSLKASSPTQMSSLPSNTSSPTQIGSSPLQAISPVQIISSQTVLSPKQLSASQSKVSFQTPLRSSPHKPLSPTQISYSKQTAISISPTQMSSSPLKAISPTQMSSTPLTAISPTQMISPRTAVSPTQMISSPSKVSFPTLLMSSPQKPLSTQMSYSPRTAISPTQMSSSQKASSPTELRSSSQKPLSPTYMSCSPQTAIFPTKISSPQKASSPTQLSSSPQKPSNPTQTSSSAGIASTPTQVEEYNSFSTILKDNDTVEQSFSNTSNIINSYHSLEHSAYIKLPQTISSSNESSTKSITDVTVITNYKTATEKLINEITTLGMKNDRVTLKTSETNKASVSQLSQSETRDQVSLTAMKGLESYDSTAYAGIRPSSTFAFSTRDIDWIVETKSFMTSVEHTTIKTKIGNTLNLLSASFTWHLNSKTGIHIEGTATPAFAEIFRSSEYDTTDAISDGSRYDYDYDYERGQPVFTDRHSRPFSGESVPEQTKNVTESRTTQITIVNNSYNNAIITPSKTTDILLSGEIQTEKVDIESINRSSKDSAKQEWPDPMWIAVGVIAIATVLSLVIAFILYKRRSRQKKIADMRTKGTNHQLVNKRENDKQNEVFSQSQTKKKNTDKQGHLGQKHDVYVDEAYDL